MGQPVVHFEVIGKDGPALSNYYSELFGWNINAENPMNYGLVTRDENVREDGAGIGGGIARGPDGYEGHVTFYVEVPSVAGSIEKAVSLGGEAIFGPETIMDGAMTLGQFKDPEGHLIGLVEEGAQSGT